MPGKKPFKCGMGNPQITQITLISQISFLSSASSAKYAEKTSRQGCLGGGRGFGSI
jgi:hypothetical protein